MTAPAVLGGELADVRAGRGEWRRLAEANPALSRVRRADALALARLMRPDGTLCVPRLVIALTMVVSVRTVDRIIRSMVDACLLVRLERSSPAGPPVYAATTQLRPGGVAGGRISEWLRALLVVRDQRAAGRAAERAAGRIPTRRRRDERPWRDRLAGRGRRSPGDPDPPDGPGP